MKVHINLTPKYWPTVTKRQQPLDPLIHKKAIAVFKKVNKLGDKALRYYGKIPAKMPINCLKVAESDFENSESQLSSVFKASLHQAIDNIYKFHEHNKKKFKPLTIATGIKSWIETRPIEKVGIFLGGTNCQLISQLLMFGIPAKIAGCREIIICIAPNKKIKVQPAILYCMKKLGIKNLYQIGGAPAVAAMSLGTAMVPKCDKIFGSGNQDVNQAKLIAQQFGTPIDFPNGPNEFMVIADNTCKPEYIAADLISKAEHGIETKIVLVVTDVSLIKKVLDYINEYQKILPNAESIKRCLASSHAFVFSDLETAISFSNAYAPQQLILAVENELFWAEKVMNAGSVFLGNLSCETFGDYVNGTNQIMPSFGLVKAYSGINVSSFEKEICFQKTTMTGLKKLRSAAVKIAEEEDKLGHKLAVAIRLIGLKQP